MDTQTTTQTFSLALELKPKRPYFTPFNIITVPVILLGVVLVVMRFALGLGSVTNLSQDFPWGLWIGFDVLVGIAFAGGSYVISFMYYILGKKVYHPIVRVTVLNGFLSYSFYAGALVLDLGRPWNAFNFLIGNEFGVASVMFMVAWHFFLYTLLLLVEFVPALAEWIGAKRLWKAVNWVNLVAVVLGITIALGHQSGVGGLFLLAKAKIHPLWYSPMIPLLFLVSSMFAGLCMVIFEGSITSRAFRARLSDEMSSTHDIIVINLAKVCTGIMAVYLALKVFDLFRGNTWALLATPFGAWYLLEVAGFVIIPGALFFSGSRKESLPVIKAAAVMAMIGIFINRFNFVFIAYNWTEPVRYYPSWMEIVVTLTVIFTELWVYRWVINRMPVISERPRWAREHGQNKDSDDKLYQAV